VGTAVFDPALAAGLRAGFHGKGLSGRIGTASVTVPSCARGPGRASSKRRIHRHRVSLSHLRISTYSVQPRRPLLRVAPRRGQDRAPAGNRSGAASARGRVAG
jgi:hypothetical protein